MENIEQIEEGMKLVEKFLKSKGAASFQWNKGEGLIDIELFHLSFQWKGQKKEIDLPKDDIED